MSDILPSFKEFIAPEEMEKFEQAMYALNYMMHVAATDYKYVLKYNKEELEQLASEWWPVSNTTDKFIIATRKFENKGVIYPDDTYNIFLRSTGQNKLRLLIKYPSCEAMDYMRGNIGAINFANDVYGATRLLERILEGSTNMRGYDLDRAADSGSGISAFPFLSGWFELAEEMMQLDIKKKVADYDSSDQLKAINFLTEHEVMEKMDALVLKQRLGLPIDPNSVDDEMLGSLI